jgi:hypothetical protein
MLAVVALVALAAGGCTKTFTIRPVATPQNVYAAATQPGPGSIGITDGRTAAARPVSAGTLNVVLKGMDDELVYLGENLARVLRAQGIMVTNVPSGPADVTLNVLTYRIRNLRTSGFSPYHTFTTFAADLGGGATPRRITAYFKNSKVPVWAFDEVERPCRGSPRPFPPPPPTRRASST